MKKILGQSRFTEVKCKKFATVSSQICIMQHAFVPFVGHALAKICKKRADPCRYYTTAFIFHARFIKVQEKPKI